VTKSRPKYRQVAALPYRLGGAGCEVVLVTSRGRGRWILPKGWPIKGLGDHEAAGIEALEEAGLVGRPGRRSVGSYTYVKRLGGRTLTVTVDVYPFEILEQRPKWRERGQREVGWFSAEEAAAKVSDEGVGALIGRFVEALTDEARRSADLFDA
jgi:8-oxo-dGTP pyrophosphatase MutT (NUDIX family)